MPEYRIPKDEYKEPEIGNGFIPLDHANRMHALGFKLEPLYDRKFGTSPGETQKVVGYGFVGSFATWIDPSTGDRMFSQPDVGRIE